jgi:hypothetical protein
VFKFLSGLAGKASALLGWKLYLGIGLAIALAFGVLLVVNRLQAGTIAAQAARIDALAQREQVLLQANRQWSDTLNVVQRDRDRAFAALDERDKAMAAIRSTIDEVRREMRNAASKENPAVGLPLRIAIERLPLRERDAAAGDNTRAGAPGDPARPADVRGRAAAPVAGSARR